LQAKTGSRTEYGCSPVGPPVLLGPPQPWLPRDARETIWLCSVAMPRLLWDGLSLPYLRGNWSFEESLYSFPFSGTTMNS
jgi:hypothetical protein